LQENENVLFQILFQPTRLGWAEEIQKLQSNLAFRKVLQENNPSLSSSLREKLSSPLFAVVVRILAQSVSRPKSWEILKRIGGNLTQFTTPNDNKLIALSNDNYPDNNHLLSTFSRTSYRSGMILNVAVLEAVVEVLKTQHDLTEERINYWHGYGVELTDAVKEISRTGCLLVECARLRGEGTGNSIDAGKFSKSRKCLVELEKSNFIQPFENNFRQ
jgi:ribosomal protein S16